MSTTEVQGVTVTVAGAAEGRGAEILSAEALRFVAMLRDELGARREELQARQSTRRLRLASGERLDFLAETRAVREGDWTTAPAPPLLRDRRVEITGPVDRKMIINALNSGARCFMADFEDSLAPTWSNVLQGQINLIDAIDGTIEYTAPDGREYRLGENLATLLVRPRGWHLEDKHVLIGGRPVSASLLDFGLFAFHNARRLLDAGAGPYFYLPKMESHLEARLWNDAFVLAQDALGIERGTIRATVLIETVPAAFEMEEILYELRDHSAGLNAGRWDYIFSMIKCFREDPAFLLPDRGALTMTVPFMRAYTEPLVSTCHRREAHAIGGMAVLIPSRRDQQANDKALAAVRTDKQREAEDGFEGTWVAHPDVVAGRRGRIRQRARLAAQPSRPAAVRRLGYADALLDVASAPGARTEAGLRNNINVGIQYLSSWLRGNGAVGIHGLMEDAATAEISRSQVWQWVHHEAPLEDGTSVTRGLVKHLEGEELERIRAEIGDDDWFETHGRPRESRELFEQVALADDFVDFLTLVAYERLQQGLVRCGSLRA